MKVSFRPGPASTIFTGLLADLFPAHSPAGLPRTSPTLSPCLWAVWTVPRLITRFQASMKPRSTPLKKHVSVVRRLEVLGKFSAAFAFSIFVAATVASLTTLVVVLVQLWRVFSLSSFWGALVVTSFAGSVLFLLVLLLLVLLAFMLEAVFGAINMRLRYSIRWLRQTARSLPSDPSTLLAQLSQSSPAHVSQFLSQASRDLSSDDLTPPTMFARLKVAENLLAELDARLSTTLASPALASPALSFLYEHLGTYDSPPSRMYASSPPAPQIPPSTCNDPEVLFVLNGRHRVENHLPSGLSAEQFALSAVLRNFTWEVSKSRHVRLMVAPGWLHALLVRDSASFEHPYAPLLPSVSEAYSIKEPSAVAELLASIWAPPLGFVRALSAAQKLNATSRITASNL